MTSLLISRVNIFTSRNVISYQKCPLLQVEIEFLISRNSILTSEDLIVDIKNS